MLVAIGLTFVQVVLGSAWLILYPPGTDLEGETWRCTPTERFEIDLVISLVYVMVLIAATILFCFETWHAEENSKETRWILLASLFTTIAWCVWTVVATQAPITFRDPAIVIGNLICATVVILFLYARKMYLYSQLTKDVKDLEMRSHYTAATSLYNASLNAQKMADPLPRTPGVEINAGMPGRQFVVVGKTVRLHHPKGPVVGRVLGPPRPLLPPPRPLGPPPRHMGPPLRPTLVPSRPLAKGISANSLLPPGARR